jgi:hypothetical protein
MFCLSLKTRVPFLSGHSDSFWVTVLSTWDWLEEGRAAFWQQFKPGAASCNQHHKLYNLSMEAMHYRNEIPSLTAFIA